MRESNEARWGAFGLEVSKSGLIWTIEKDGEFTTSATRHGTRAFPWWSSRERVLEQLAIVPAYAGYQQSGFEWQVFISEWVPSLKQAGCLLGVNYSGVQNIGFDLPVDEVVSAVVAAMRNMEA